MGYKKPNTGSLYVNGYKKSEDQPDMTGTVIFDVAFLQEFGHEAATHVSRGTGDQDLHADRV